MLKTNMYGPWIILLLSLAILTHRVESSPAKPVSPSSSLQPEGLAALDPNEGSSEPQTCGYQSCPAIDRNKINVHIVAHTHDDVGWLKTVDQYYYGTNKRYSQVGVQHILDSVIPQLVMDRTKRFIYVEMSFFVKWWLEQEEPMRRIVKQLVNQGRLEFINGGWCMNDEATVNYQSTIEQMTLGLKFLNETFGACGHPKVGWQIDPFGHSSEQASLFAQFGFDGMFFTRINYMDKEHRIDNKSLDIIWHGDRILSGQSGSIFTNIFKEGYDAPNGYCFDVLCLDDNLVDNKNSFEYNINVKGDKFISYIREYAKAKLTSNILIPMGGDFQYSAAGQNFKDLDKLMRYVRSNANEINIFYSSPSCYQMSLYQSTRQRDIRLPEKYDDFIPYDSSHSVWWSGYFSSRPSVKLIERETADLLQIARFVSLANLIRLSVGGPGQQAGENSWQANVRDHEKRCLVPLWEILSDLQHHDAVTGTEKQHVSNDYVRRASMAYKKCAKFMGEMRRKKLDENLKRSTRYQELKNDAPSRKFHSIAQLSEPIYLEETQFCFSLNISECEPIESEIDQRKYLTGNHNTQHYLHEPRPKRSTGTPSELQTKAVLINVYNPLSRPISQHDIRLPCNGRCDLERIRVVHLATNETMRLIRLPLPSGIATLPFRNAMTNYEILFYANMPALGYTSFLLEDLNDEEVVDEEEENSGDSILINDDNFDANKSAGSRSRRTRNAPVPICSDRYDYFTIADGDPMVDTEDQVGRSRRSSESTLSQQSAADRVIVKFDLTTGMIVGLRRARDGSYLNVTQKFGSYLPANSGHPPGAYIFRPNTTEPYLLEKPLKYKMFKRKSGALIEIHQKWTDWIWQTIRVDAKKSYIEFDYVVGPVPVDSPNRGREVITRYISNMVNNGVFMTDSNGRQLITRQRFKSSAPEQLGGSFFPVGSTILLRSTGAVNKAGNRSSAETMAILVDRAQAGTSLNDGQIELLIHRRHLVDDNFGVAEALNEPGEDRRGLVTRGRHRLYLKFQDNDPSQTTPGPSVGGRSASAVRAQHASVTTKLKPRLIKLPDTPRANLSYEEVFYNFKDNYLQEQDKFVDRDQLRRQAYVFAAPTFIAHDLVFDDLRQEALKFALKPIMTFDRLRVTATELMDMLSSEGNSRVKTDLALLNITLPNNVHLLTLQPWTDSQSGASNNQHDTEILIRLENLDNPLTLHPYPDPNGYQALVRSYRSTGEYHEVYATDNCADKLRPRVQVDVEYLIKRIRITSLEELNLGANERLDRDSRINWTDEVYEAQECEEAGKPTTIFLAPRQIRTFLAKFEYIK